MAGFVARESALRIARHPGHGRDSRLRLVLPLPRVQRPPGEDVRHRRARAYPPVGRTLQPHPRRGMGVRPDLPLRCDTGSRLPDLPASLQPPPTPNRHRRPHPMQRPHHVTGKNNSAAPAAPAARRAPCSGPAAPRGGCLVACLAADGPAAQPDVRAAALVDRGHADLVAARSDRNGDAEAVS